MSTLYDALRELRDDIGYALTEQRRDRHVAALDYALEMLATLPPQPAAANPDEPQHGDWLAVVDDSGCTVRLGGPGHLWQFERRSYLSPGCWHIRGVAAPYSKSIFRRATQAEIEAKEDHS